ncbi:MAG: hypothetical protein V1874_00765 [Spirochaetota bacterium]
MRPLNQESITARIVLNVRCAAMRDAKHVEKAIAKKTAKTGKRILFAMNKMILA